MSSIFSGYLMIHSRKRRKCEERSRTRRSGVLFLGTIANMSSECWIYKVSSSWMALSWLWNQFERLLLSFAATGGRRRSFECWMTSSLYACSLLSISLIRSRRSSDVSSLKVPLCTFGADLELRLCSCVSSRPSSSERSSWRASKTLVFSFPNFRRMKKSSSESTNSQKRRYPMYFHGCSSRSRWVKSCRCPLARSVAAMKTFGNERLL